MKKALLLSGAANGGVGASWNQATDVITRVPSRPSFLPGYPWTQMRRCNLADDGTVNAYYGDPAFKYDGSNGQVMVEVPKFYYKFDHSATVHSPSISRYKLPGYKIHPAFVKDGVEKQYFYIGAFEGSAFDVTANATEVNTLEITAEPVANGNITLTLDGDYSFTVAILDADTIEGVVDKIVAAGVKTDYQGVTWTPAKVDASHVRYTAGSTGLKTTLARTIQTKGGVGSGTAAAADATTLTKTAAAWTVNGWAGYIVRILTGTGAGSIGVIASNTATVLTVADWLVGADPAAGSTFEITPTGVTGTVVKSTPGAGGYVKNDSGGVDFTATTGDKLCSVAGAKPISGWNNATANMTNLRIIAKNRGAGWGLQTFQQVSAIQMLMVVEYASFYAQSVLSTGITNITDDALTNMAMNTGRTAGVGTGSSDTGNATGAQTVAHYKTAQNTYPFSYRGIENFYGNLWKWVDGLSIKANNMPWVADHDFIDATFSHPYTDTGITLPASNGYGSNLAYSDALDYAFLPSAVAGANNTHLTDYYYQASGNRVARLGGGWTNGVLAGAFSWRLDDAASYVTRDIGCRLAFFA